jgi:hypothetical protein
MDYVDGLSLASVITKTRNRKPETSKRLAGEFVADELYMGAPE